MYSPIFLSTENHLNKILKKQKRTKQNISILFTSLWDDNSSDLIESLKKESAAASLYGLAPGDFKRDLYVANSFQMPHSFVIFKTFRVPTLVRLVRDSVKCEDYLPKIYEELGL
tara:strand:+ start:453 stop:794 length:342 start_codon:yes stop_codon:yes gene_type:complete